jgi:hypothetical protein
MLAALLIAITPLVQAFDQTHAAWDGLLKRHVVIAPGGNASRVDYSGFLADRNILQAYLNAVSAVSETEYREWTREQRLAFLIDSYNAYTVDLVLSRYPDLHSIKDLGSLLKSPWKKEFFTLLGARRSLDDLEHGLIRTPGAFDEPRIHFAVNCASIGCPMLRKEAFVGARLNDQLEDSARRFLADHTRNRYDEASNTLYVSRIFDWYQADFAEGISGAGSVSQFLARYADVLVDDPAGRAALLQGKTSVRFLDYDWALNDSRQ